MIRFTVLLLALLWLQVSAGCTPDNLRRGLYEGFRTNNDLQSRPSDRFGKKEAPDYQEYERLRKEQRE